MSSKTAEFPIFSGGGAFRVGELQFTNERLIWLYFSNKIIPFLHQKFCRFFEGFDELILAQIEIAQTKIHDLRFKPRRSPRSKLEGTKKLSVSPAVMNRASGKRARDHGSEFDASSNRKSVTLEDAIKSLVPHDSCPL
jgi:hypothetical protein